MDQVARLCRFGSCPDQSEGLVIEYKVINTLAEGVPLSDNASLLTEQLRKNGQPVKMTYAEQLAAGLTALNVEGGWELCGVLSQLLIFRRKKDLPGPPW